MKILVFGATGRVGSRIVNHALDDGHSVTALVRNPDKIQLRSDQLTVIEGNTLNKVDIDRVVHGIDVVFSALSTDGTTTLSKSMPSIINAMEKEGIKRIISIGTAGILNSRVSPNIFRYQSDESKRRTTRAAEEHRKVYNLLKASRLDWTIVCPTYLPDGERTGEYRVEKDYLPENGSEISVPDTSEFAFSQLTGNDYMKSRAGIAY